MTTETTNDQPMTIEPAAVDPIRQALVPTDQVQLDPEELPPILVGHATPAVQRRVAQFYCSIARIFELWVERCKSRHTRRAYRGDVMSLVEFLGIRWPDEATAMLNVSVRDILEWQEWFEESGGAPKSLNRRVSSVSSFFKYLQGAAALLKLPINVPNPAHAQFIARGSTDPICETESLSATRARQLMGLPATHYLTENNKEPSPEQAVLEHRDRAIIKFYLYSGARLATGCRLNVSDFRQDGDEYTIRIHEKGDHRRTIGLHFAAGEAIGTYLQEAGTTRGPVFRPQRGSRTEELANRHMTPAAMYNLLQSYLERLPGAMIEVEDEEAQDDENSPKQPEHRCIYSPHSLRATTATLLLDAGVEIKKVKDLLGHKHLTTTQIYDKRRLGTKESASHDVPI